MGGDTNDFSPSARSGNESEIQKSDERKEESIPASKRVLLTKPTKVNHQGKKSKEEGKKGTKKVGAQTVKEIESERELEEIYNALRNFRNLAEVNRNFSSSVASDLKGIS